MRILVTGGCGKVGRAATKACRSAGHEVTVVDLRRPVYEASLPDEPSYIQADMTDAGQAFAVVAAGFDAVVHAAAIPEPFRNPGAVVLQTNLMAAHNVVDAATRLGVKRLVNVSTEAILGYAFARRKFPPLYVPIDEDHPIRPRDPYSLSKSFAEQLCEAAAHEYEISCISVRPAWVQGPGNYRRNLGPQLRHPEQLSWGLWSYVDSDDLGDALRLAVECELVGHEIVYVAAPDIASTYSLANLLDRHFEARTIEIRSLPRPDAGPISIEKAKTLLGYSPSRSWRHYLDESGELVVASS